VVEGDGGHSCLPLCGRNGLSSPRAASAGVCENDMTDSLQYDCDMAAECELVQIEEEKREKRHNGPRVSLMSEKLMFVIGYGV
jgi:hypothetical protein